MTTYRERREAKADRYREWADKRDAKANSDFAGVDRIADNIPLGQPILVGHHSEGRARKDQERIRNGMRRGIDNQKTADRMRSKADEIERQADRAVYSDDTDAIERLEARIAKREAKRDRIKAHNAAARKEGRREDVQPAYVLSNLGATIRNDKKRLAGLVGLRDGTHVAVGSYMLARFDSEGACGHQIAKGDEIVYYRATREAKCFRCVKQEAGQ